ncbi:anti-sigma factor family protein [Saccharothrix syringae]|uniref:Zf-HC2 domain-containing protein n=1 Tax=Saccharothrix syringae TaxID=103733 RepID=A0A5Q0H997_SACSY|nr:zf-HC2 domain-containing protein [Saccharothrix syringae]QFZ22791.1 zf-HC2 domain-containing protein [Saccharothrix syringae]
MSCTHTVVLGAYLLGSLDPPERADFELHVPGCATCRREMVRLAPLPGLLGQVRLEDLELPFDDPAPEPALWPLPPLPEPEPAAPRRRVRWSLLVGAAALVLVVLGAVLLVPPLLRDDAPAGVTWQAANSSSGAAASIDLVAKSWGTELWMTMRDMPEGARCALIVHDRAGRTEIGGWWGTDHPDDERIPGSTSFRVEEIERLDVVVDKQVLVSVRP